MLLLAASSVLMKSFNCLFLTYQFQGLANDFCCYGYRFSSFMPTLVVSSPSSYYVCNFRFCIFIYLYCVFCKFLIFYRCIHTSVCVHFWFFGSAQCSHLSPCRMQLLALLPSLSPLLFPLTLTAATYTSAWS